MTHPLNRETAALIMIRDGGPMTIDRENVAAENDRGVASLTVIHALERKLLVSKSGATFVLTVAGRNLADTLTRRP